MYAQISECPENFGLTISPKEVAFKYKAGK
jgi:hypothetical protein